MQEILHQSPETLGLAQSRWSLPLVRQAVPWMAELSLPGVWQILDRWDLVYKRGRRYVHSPDPLYGLKAARLRAVAAQVQAAPDRLVLLYQDELTSYRCPTVACDYALRGSDEPRAAQGTGYTSSRRIAGCLDALTGRLFCWQRAAFEHETFLRYLLAVQAFYPLAEQIFIALDNRPVHFHVDVLAGLKESKITLVFLPTYSPWLNPIEKVWRKLKQEILHLHRFSSRWKQLQQRVDDWLTQYSQPSSALLRYVGLSPT